MSFYLPPLVVLALLVARIIELSRRFPAVPGKVTAPRTFAAMALAGTGLALVALAEYFVRHLGFNGVSLGIGLAVGVSAFLLRGAARRALGQMWSVHVEIRTEHQLVQSGPYRFVRHPIYTGAILEILGAVIILQANLTLLLALFVYTPVLLWRIRTEEAAMAAHFGPAWQEYCRRTPPLLPFPTGPRAGPS